jgi:hypothetical protein
MAENPEGRSRRPVTSLARSGRSAALRLLFFALFACGGVVGLAPSAALSVDRPAIFCASADGSPDAEGRCWDDPLDLQTALARAQPGDQVRLRQGRYIPGDNPHSAFYLPNGVEVVGGFTGSLDDPDERSDDPALTVLDGEGNRYTVMIVAGVADAKLSGVAIQNGAATLIADEATDLQRRGGGVFISNASVSFQNVLIADNAARFGGGGVYIAESSAVSLIDVVFKSNQTTHPQSGRGGGLRLENGELSMSNVVFRGNRAIRGGGIFLDDGIVRIQSGIFIDNEAADRGGAIAIYRGDVDIGSSELRNNIAIREGAGLFASRAAGSTMIIDTVVEANRSGNGGAGAWLQSAEITIERSHFRLNSAGNGPGGGLYASNALAWINAVEFRGNQAGIGAGAALRNVDATIVNALFGGNFAGPPEILVDFDAGRPPPDDPHRESSIADPLRGIITGEVFGSDYLTDALDEQAHHAGGGLLIYGSGTASIINTTIAANRSEGRGPGLFHSGEMNVELHNSIIAGNMNDRSDVRFDRSEKFEASIAASILDGGCPDGSHAVCYSVTTSDPRFLDPPENESAPTVDGDFRLWFTSPAIDAGLSRLAPDDIDFDLLGNERQVRKRPEETASYMMGPIDIGAFEAQIPELLTDNRVQAEVRQEDLVATIDVIAHENGFVEGEIAIQTPDWSAGAIRLGRIYREGRLITIDGEAVLDSGALTGLMIELDLDHPTEPERLRVRLDSGYASDWTPLASRTSEQTGLPDRSQNDDDASEGDRQGAEHRQDAGSSRLE